MSWDHSMSRAIFTCVCAMSIVAMKQGSAAVITQWDFNSNPPDANTSTGTTNPSIGSGTAALQGGTTATFGSGDASGGSSDPAAGDDSGWNTSTYPAQGVDPKTAGAGFLVSTVGYEDIIVNWDQRHSNTASRFAQFQYTTDGGGNWSDFGALWEGDQGGDRWYNQRTTDLSSLAAVDNNPGFGFRIVSAFDPASNMYVATTSTSTYSTTGTWRFDMVTVNGTLVPEPAMAVLGALGAMASLWARRRVWRGAATA